MSFPNGFSLMRTRHFFMSKIPNLGRIEVQTERVDFRDEHKKEGPFHKLLIITSLYLYILLDSLHLCMQDEEDVPHFHICEMDC